MLLAAIVLITGALVFYTLGVWGEQIQKTLKLWHIVLFYLGLFCDTTGTYLMSQIAQQSSAGNHAITGAIALVLMFIHAVWATIVFVRKKDMAMKQFHKFSMIVWMIWLVPYLAGMISNMM